MDRIRLGEVRISVSLDMKLKMAGIGPSRFLFRHARSMMPWQDFPFVTVHIVHDNIDIAIHTSAEGHQTYMCLVDELVR